MNRAQKQLYANNYNKKREKYVPPYSKKFKTAIDEQNQAYYDEFEKHEDLETLEEIAEGVKVPKEPMVKSYRNLYLVVGTAFAINQLTQLNRSTEQITESTPKITSDIDKYITKHTGKRITEVTNTTKEMMLDTVKDVVRRAQSEEPMTYRQAADEIKRMSGDIADYRAMRIARTEITSASSFGGMAAAMNVSLETGIKLQKIWVSGGGPKERPEHMPGAIDPDKVDLDEAFIVGGEPMMEPGDFSASAAMVCNCQCCLIFE